MKLYFCYDKIAERYFMPLLSETDGSVIRENLIYATRAKPLADLAIYQVADFNIENGSLSVLDKPRLVDLDSYKFPESVAKVIKQTEFEHKIAEYNLENRDNPNAEKSVDVVEK